MRGGAVGGGRLRGRRGGTNGGDGSGPSGSGGHGSGLDVGLLGSEKFILVPGEGGEAYGTSGGGGGGVIVNGRKPGESSHKGEGFGGGGSGSNDEGFPGCVVIEMN